MVLIILSCLEGCFVFDVFHTRQIQHVEAIQTRGINVACNIGALILSTARFISCIVAGPVSGLPMKLAVALLSVIYTASKPAF